MAQASHLAACDLCPRQCGVDRLAGRTGYCGAGATAEIYRYGPHLGEEPPVSGTQGSGTVFFSRCTLRCLYCQNHPWSQGGEGEPYGPAALADALRELAVAGCHNWNLVSPTPWLPMIREALAAVRRDGWRLPVVYNTSGYERPETLHAFRDCADLYLADLRYAREESAAEGSGAAGYVAAARTALQAMWDLAGPLRTDARGLATGGVICRLLILPGRAGEAVENLRWLAEHLGRDVAVSVMAQYTPAHRAAGRPPWDRRITPDEYQEVCDAMEEMGFATGWIQDLQAPTPDALLGFRMEAGRFKA